jgi:lon-related putative ATP-dependent protease
LRRVCDPAGLEAASTGAVTPLDRPLGQARAMAALEFGTDIAGPGYNTFVLGAAGTGRSLMTRMILDEAAARREPPAEWCYVHNFEDSRRPRALRLPAGQGAEFRRDAEELIAGLDQGIAAVFESDDYQSRRDEALKQFREERQREFGAFEAEAEAAGFTIGRGPAGLIVAPAKDGEVMAPQEYAALPDEERNTLEKRREEFQEKLADLLRRGHRQEHEAREQVRQLDREMVQFASAHLIEALAEKYRDLPEVVEHLQALTADLVSNVAQFRNGEEQTPPLPLPPGMTVTDHSPYDRYRVNLLTETAKDHRAPVVYEANPTLHILVGEVEYQTQMGALVTDFSMIRAGALHRANGGYLMLDALALLTRPYAWDALKRALRSQELRIESIGDQFRFVSTVTLEPQPIPLDVKVVLIGTPQIYYLLYQLDEDFAKLFKVKADLGSDMERTPETEKLYLRYLARVCQERGLPEFTAAAVAEVVEQASRRAENQEKLTTRFMEIADLAQEATYWAGRREVGAAVRAEDVRQAFAQQVWRSNRIEERVLDAIEDGELLVDTRGAAVGQVNGLSLLPLGDYTVGKPSRITARSALGRAGVINIEREVKLSGPIHDKGVLIISGYLGQKYAARAPLSCSVSIVFEQSYEGVEGDSASAAELFAVLSSLGDLPLRQDLAVTGSVNQHGLIQPIGGANRKIEGYFEACQRQGLTGTQGVLLPASNQRHLMLRAEVVEAVRAGQFHIYTMRTLDEGLELLTGLPAGEPDESGQYPDGTVHGAVQQRLTVFAEALKQFGAGEEEAGKSDAYEA